MQLPASEVLVSAFRDAESKSLPALFEELRGVERDLFPPDVLRGASPESLFRHWINTNLKPRLREAGDEGRLWWRALTRIDLAREPELLAQVLAVLSAWFLPGGEKYANTLALLIVIRKLAKDEDLDR